jgi:hypothetical protein
VSNDISDDPEFKEWLEHAEAEVLPKMHSSAFSIALISRKVDAKLCLEIGAAILLEKPLIVLAMPGAKIPPVLARLAHEIVRGHPRDAETKKHLTEAIESLMRKAC